MQSPKPHSIWSTRVLVQLVFGCVAAIFLIRGALALTTAQSQSEERTFKLREFKNMPVRVWGVKNLQSKSWPNRLEIEIENTSNKRIYYICSYLMFPDVPVPNGVFGAKLEFGNIENHDIARQAMPEDDYLAPGESISLVIGELYRKGLLAKQGLNPEHFNKTEFEFSTISFGDGTGFEGGTFIDLRQKKP